MIKINKKIISQILADNSIEKYKKELKHNIFQELEKNQSNIDYDFLDKNLDELLSLSEDND